MIIINSIRPLDLDYFSYSHQFGLLSNLILFALVTVLCLYLLAIFELKIHRKVIAIVRSVVFDPAMKSCVKNHRESPELQRSSSTVPDYDVLAERNLIASLNPAQDYRNYNLIVKDLTKRYDHVLAVNKVNFALRPGECLGLLGINGAGKTSTFKMLTGDTHISAGNVFFGSSECNVRDNSVSVHEKMGYCPQFDALFDNLTGWEMLKFYSLCRGSDIDSSALQLAKDFDLSRHLDRKVAELSGGNKRKLSTVVALIGDPSCIFLDEPTTSMDPIVKKEFWRAICAIRDRGKTIILSSHSMDECEAVCTRIAILAKGELKCMGTPQYLKEKVGNVLILTLRLRRIEVEEELKMVQEELKNFVAHSFCGAILK
jgi:ATP-binding cassette, subfamily A (ABC1), member 3